MLADLRDVADALGTESLTEHAISRGIRPPDGRPGWAIVLQYGPKLDERGLFWVDPDGE